MITSYKTFLPIDKAHADAVDIGSLSNRFLLELT